MTTSSQKRIGSASERAVAALLGGKRIGMDGGPVDVVIPDYAWIQVKNVKAAPSMNAIGKMIRLMPSNLLRGVVVIERAGQGVRGSRTITFDLDDYAAWHGDKE